MQTTLERPMPGAPSSEAYDSNIPRRPSLLPNWISDLIEEIHQLVPKYFDIELDKPELRSKIQNLKEALESEIHNFSKHQIDICSERITSILFILNRENTATPLLEKIHSSLKEKAQLLYILPYAKVVITSEQNNTHSAIKETLEVRSTPDDHTINHIIELTAETTELKLAA